MYFIHKKRIGAELFSSVIYITVVLFFLKVSLSIDSNNSYRAIERSSVTRKNAILVG